MELHAMVKWAEQICRWQLFVCLFACLCVYRGGVYVGVLEGATLCRFIDQLIN